LVCKTWETGVITQFMLFLSRKNAHRFCGRGKKKFEAVFFFPVKFSSIKKMIIAPREFYEGQNHLLTDKTIDYGHFKDKDINKRKPKDVINIHLQKAK
jgi:hypothetical protein